MYYPGIQIDQRVFSNLLYRNRGLRPDQAASSKDQSQADQIINHLNGLKDSDPDWYYSKDVDPKTGRLRRFISRFWLAQKALTKEEFDERWKGLMDDYGKDDRARYHLYKLYDNRDRWVRYSVERCFTNNTQATGGVEKVHHLIKTHLHGKRTHLLGVFHGVQQRANKETIKSDSLQAYRNKHIKRPDAYAHAMFSLVRSMNGRYLSPYACDKMEAAMAAVSLLLTQRLPEQDWSSISSSKVASISKASNPIVSKSTRIKATKTRSDRKTTGARQDEEDDGVSMNKTGERLSSNDHPLLEESVTKILSTSRCGVMKQRREIGAESRAIDNTITNKKMAATMAKQREEEEAEEEDKAMARQLVDYKPDTIDPFSFQSFVKEIGQERIDGVFEVTSSINPILLQRVILLMDGSHICTCRSLQNAGLVCAHFFATMVFSDESRYHIGLINRRWYLEKWQNDIHLESDIKNEPFVHAKSQLNAPLDIMPAKRFMDSYLEVFPAQRHAIRPPVSEAIKEQRVDKIDEALRSIRANAVNGDQGSCDRTLKRVFRFCSINTTQRAPSPSDISDSNDTEKSTSGLHKELDSDVRESSSSNTDTTNDTHSGGDSNYSESSSDESSYDSSDSGKDGPGWIDPTELVLGSRFDFTNKDSSSRRQRSEEQGAERIRDPHRVAGKGRTKGKRNKHRAEIISDMNRGKMPFSGSYKRKWSNDSDGEIAVIKRPSHCSVCGMPGHNRATCLSKKACLLEEK
ncbi:MAG: hypothetical protein J3R72DRAFT_481229 [Linnemannia gamsii]|nr:MAG: hypothetical protein J3R72DRAFT_481229 [Linnemannia gamsii]